MNMKANFMLWGLTSTLTPSTTGVLNVPFPDNNNFSNENNVKAQKAADGTTVAQMVGRTLAQFNISWTVMTCAKWWEINNWLATNGIIFYCKYFNYNKGIWETHQFMATNPQCSPYRPTSDAASQNWGKPQYLRNCKLTITDLGGE